MTDRAHAFIVVLDDDYRLGDYIRADNEVIPIGAEAILQSIRMIKGVFSVEPVVADSEDYIARMRVGSKIRKQLHNAIDEALS